MQMAKKLLQMLGIVVFNSLIKSRELKEASVEKIDMWVLLISSNSILTKGALYSLYQSIRFNQV